MAMLHEYIWCLRPVHANHGMVSNLGPYDQGNGQEQLGINFERLVQVRGERENAKEWKKEEKKLNSKDKKKCGTPRAGKRKKTVNTRPPERKKEQKEKKIQLQRQATS